MPCSQHVATRGRNQLGSKIFSVDIVEYNQCWARRLLQPLLFNTLQVRSALGAAQRRKLSFKNVSSVVVQLLHSIKYSMEVPFSNIATPGDHKANAARKVSEVLCGDCGGDGDKYPSATWTSKPFHLHCFQNQSLSSGTYVCMYVDLPLVMGYHQSLHIYHLCGTLC